MLIISLLGVSYINQKYIEYVKNAVSQGHDLASIRSFMLKNNMPQSEVDQAIAYISNNTKNATPNNILPTQTISPIEIQLRSYVSTQQSRGYSIDAIKQSLIQQGYSQFLIDKIINQNSINIHVKHEVSGKTLIVVFLGIIILGALGYIFFYTDILGNKELALLDASINIDKSEYNIGDSISYNIELTSMGSKNRFDANINYLVIDSSGKTRKTYSETIAVDTRSSKPGKIPLDNLPAGSYNLKAIVSYGGSSNAESSVTFDIISPQTASQPDNTKTPTVQTNPNQNPTTNPAPITSPSSGQSNLPDIIQISPTDKFGDTLAIIRNQAKNNPATAAANCAKFTSSTQKDICYSAVADSSGKPVYCDYIKSVDDKDNCYFAFVIYGNTDVCVKINDSQMNAYCNQVKIVYQMNHYNQIGDTAKVQELYKQWNPTVYNSGIQPKNYDNIYNQPTTLKN